MNASGILLLDKAEGMSSAKALAKARALMGRPKAGHLGTLDPMATGLLPLCIAEGTKIARYLADHGKAYSGLIRLGLRTDTLDITGQTLDSQVGPDPGSLDLEALAGPFIGTIEQRPPAFSAIKKGGVPSYRLARRGQAEEPPPRPVTIAALKLWAAGPALVGFEMDCSKGTYVRSLARDIGESIGCGASLAGLRRTRFGPFRVEESITLEELEELEELGTAAVARAFVSLLGALGQGSAMETLAISPAEAVALRQGRQDCLGGRAAAPGAAGRAACLVCKDELVAIVRESKGAWQLERVLGAGPAVALRPDQPRGTQSV